MVNPAHIVLIDGRSGAGKTEYGITLAQDMEAQLVSLDDVYPGWDGLDAGSWHVWQNLILPISKGQPGSYRKWDWVSKRPGMWVTLPANTRIVVEGCGSIRSDQGDVVVTTFWIEAPDALRRERAIARDGATYLPHWERWARQEERFLSLHDGRARAETVVTSL